MLIKQIKKDELGRQKLEDLGLPILQMVRALVALKISVREQMKMATLLEMLAQ